MTLNSEPPPGTRIDFDLDHDPSELECNPDFGFDFNPDVESIHQSTPKRPSGAIPRSDFDVSLSSPLSSSSSPPENKDDDDSLINPNFKPNLDFNSNSDSSNPISTSDPTSSSDTSTPNFTNDKNRTDKTDKTDLQLIVKLLTDLSLQGERKTKTNEASEAAYKALGIALGVLDRNGWVGGGVGDGVMGGKGVKDVKHSEDVKKEKDVKKENDVQDMQDEKDGNEDREGWYHEARRIYQDWVGSKLGSKFKLKLQVGGKDVRSKVSPCLPSIDLGRAPSPKYTPCGRKRKTEGRIRELKLIHVPTSPLDPHSHFRPQNSNLNLNPKMYRPSDDDHDLTHADESFEALLNTAPRSFPIGLLVNKPLERLRSRNRGRGRGRGRARVAERRSGTAATTGVLLAVDPFRAGDGDGDGDGDVGHEGEQDKDGDEEDDLDQAETTVLWAPGNTPWAKGPVERVFPEQEEDDGKLSESYPSFGL